MDLVKYNEARNALVAAHQVDEVKSIRDKALAMQAYAQQAKDTELISYATEIRLRAERRAGELLRDMEKHEGGRPKKTGNKSQPVFQPKLAELGVTKAQSSRWQKLADLPEDKFEARVAKHTKLAIAGASGDQAVVRELRAEQQVEKRQRRTEREQALGAKQVALPDKRYGVILADPEWKSELLSRETEVDRAADNLCSTGSLDVITARDVPSIAAEDCVLFLWATVSMLPHALLVMQAWGFDYRSHFVWAKDRQGAGR